MITDLVDFGVHPDRENASAGQELSQNKQIHVPFCVLFTPISAPPGQVEVQNHYVAVIAMRGLARSAYDVGVCVANARELTVIFVNTQDEAFGLISARRVTAAERCRNTKVSENTL